MNLQELDKPLVAIVQLRHQPAGVMHQVVLRPDKVKKIKRICSLGHEHESAVIVLGETEGDQAAGWQYPETIQLVAILGEGVEEKGKWICKPLP